MSLRRRLPGVREAPLALVTTACLVVLLEIGWRWAGHAPRVDPGIEPSVTTYYLVSDPWLGFRNRANGSFRNLAVTAEPLVTTDRDGFRNGLGWDPDGEEPVLVFLGDSTTFGAEVEDDQTGPSEVARRLGGPVRALNAGVRGYNTVQSIRMLERVLELHPRVRWAVYTVCGNDWRENLDPAIHYPALSPTVRRTAEGFRSIEPASSRPPGTPVTEAYVPRSIRLQLWVLRRSAILDTLFVAGPPFGRPPATMASFDELTAVFVELLGRMRRLAEEHGVTLGVTYFTRGADEAWRRTAEAAAEAGLPFLPIHDAFTRDPADYAAPRADGGYDDHYGALGTRTWAEALEPHLRKWLEERGNPPTPPLFQRGLRAASGFRSGGHIHAAYSVSRHYAAERSLRDPVVGRKVHLSAMEVAGIPHRFRRKADSAPVLDQVLGVQLSSSGTTKRPSTPYGGSSRLCTA